MGLVQAMGPRDYSTFHDPLQLALAKRDLRHEPFGPACENFACSLHSINSPHNGKKVLGFIGWRSDTLAKARWTVAERKQEGLR